MPRILRKYPRNKENYETYGRLEMCITLLSKQFNEDIREEVKQILCPHLNIEEIYDDYWKCTTCGKSFNANSIQRFVDNGSIIEEENVRR